MEQGQVWASVKDQKLVQQGGQGDSVLEEKIISRPLGREGPQVLGLSWAYPPSWQDWLVEAQKQVSKGLSFPIRAVQTTDAFCRASLKSCSHKPSLCADPLAGPTTLEQALCPRALP